MRNIFYNNWETVFSTMAKGLLIYIILIIFLRAIGKRSLSKLNIFDFIITIAIGSVFASTLTSKDVKIAQGTMALVVLLGGQYIISKLAFKSDKFEKLIKADPALLYYEDTFLFDTMENERITKREVLQAVRNSGASSLKEVRAVILETDGTISVISQSDNAPNGLDNELYDSVKINPEDDLI